ncbi:outer membrane protein [Rhodoblastus sp.]|uniref:outer membrane protein n=1 Tax=Rhodoblastus sp. TaxID=1962975 RepID=UPI003F9DFCC4
MRNLLLSTVAFAALAGSAFAADLPSTKEAPVYMAPTPAFSWTGFYIGADIGGAFASSSLNNSWNGWTSHSSDTSGVMGGGYVGYNYQFNQNFVLGLEGDFQGTSNSQSSNWFSPITLGNITAGDAISERRSLDWLASINGRVGVAYDRALFYAIGGAAWAGGTGTVTDWNIPASASLATSVSGFDVGAGVDYAFTPNWIGRIEYRYYDFGNNTFTGFGATTPFRTETSVNSIRVGLAYLFSSPAPVVAKY